MKVSIAAGLLLFALACQGCEVQSAAQVAVNADAAAPAKPLSAETQTPRDGKWARQFAALQQHLAEAEVVLADDFDRDALGDAWIVEEGKWQTCRSTGIEGDGVVGINGESYPDSFLWTQQSFDGNIAVEFTAECLSDPPNDINVVICGKSPNYPPPEKPLYLFGLGGWENTMSGVERAPDYNWKSLTGLFTLQPRTPYRVQAARMGNAFILLVDGRKVMEAKDLDPLPASGQIALHVFNSRVRFSQVRVKKL